jgi:broad specificity phosphatase PhoE
MRHSRVRFGEVADSSSRRGNFFARYISRNLCRNLCRNTLLICLAFLVTFSNRTAIANAANDSWKKLARGGYVILLRHTATVPGVGDPPGFALNDCATQRNLSAGGRAQAERWRAAVAERKVPIGEVFSSEWCRCIDTAKIAFGQANAPPKKWSALNSFFESAQNQPAQTAAVKKRLPALLQDAKKLGNNVVFVTHQVNITALTGVAPQSGEAVVIELDAQRNVSVIGRVLVE